jgi:hypothetical protein
MDLSPEEQPPLSPHEGDACRISKQRSKTVPPTIIVNMSKSTKLALHVIKGAWCVVRGAWCVVRGA